MSDITTSIKERATGIREGLTISRSYSDWSSPKGFNTQSVPWKLWEKAKLLHWNPSDIDFSKDAEDWAAMPVEYKLDIAGLAAGFMVGEEGVTLDILPLLQVMADQGRVEDVMYLTTFSYEEAKHVDFFRRWFTALDIDLDEIRAQQEEQLRSIGVEPPPQGDGMFELELPRVMGRLRHDHSPEAVLDAAVTYNQFVEGSLALAGYKVWGEIFSSFGVMPGLQAGLGQVRVDESRHITYGTYLARRILAEHPELMDFARRRMYELRDWYFAVTFPHEVVRPEGEAPGLLDPEGPFAVYAKNQVERRIQIMERGTLLNADEAELGAGAEEAEAVYEDERVLVEA